MEKTGVETRLLQTTREIVAVRGYADLSSNKDSKDAVRRSIAQRVSHMVDEVIFDLRRLVWQEQPNLDALSGRIGRSVKAVGRGRYACPRRFCHQDI
jgi:hypothetical protein